MTEELPSELPESVVGLVECAGLPAALRLVEEFGGTSFYAPKPESLDADHELAQLIGLEPALAIARQYGPALVPVPRCVALLSDARERAIRNRAIREDHKKGLSGFQLARKYQLTVRMVWYILNAPPKGDPRQLGLFGQ